MTASHRFFEWALLGMLASSSLAVAASGVVEVPSAAVALAILVRGVRLAGVWPRPIPDRLYSAIAILLIGVWSLDYAFYSKELFPATLRLVAFLSAAMIVRAGTPRDFFYVKLVALIQLIAGSVLSTGPSFFLFFACFAICGLAAQLSGEIRVNLDSSPIIAKSSIRAIAPRLLPLTFLVLAGILGLGATLFLVIPRTANAALAGLSRAGVRVPGFSNEVRLGEIGQIKMTSTPVMHVRIDGAPRVRSLKWRGSALVQFDGKRWFNEAEAGERVDVEGGHFQAASREQMRTPGPRISYEVQLKSLANDVLFFAGIPESVGINARVLLRTSVGGYRLAGGFPRPLRYEVFRAQVPEDARPVWRPGTRLPEAERTRYLQLPSIDPRIGELAHRLTDSELQRIAKAQIIEEYLRSSFPYTIELPAREAPDPVAQFLFERRKGHCEYFASAMAVMLRSLGIPARVATGFQSGTFNPMSGWYLIRSSDAHSWVEAFLDSYGWVTFDPTPPDPSSGVMSVWQRAGLYLDAIDVFWQEWVVNYDLEHQLALVERMGRGRRGSPFEWFEGWSRVRDSVSIDWRRGSPLIALLAFSILAHRFSPRIASWRRRRRSDRLLRSGQASPSDATLLYLRLLKALHHRGIDKPPWMTPAEFARHVPSDFSRIVTEATASYLAFRFGKRSESAPGLLALVEDLEAEAGRRRN
jgi:transglutaminase-like putative cysteine protease